MQSWNEWKDLEVSELIAHIGDLRARGVPIDAVGMEMHVWAAEPPTRDELFSSTKRYADAGLLVAMSEGDVNVYGVPGSRGDKLALQARIYADMADALLACGHGLSFSTYDLADSNSWLIVDPNVHAWPGDAPGAEAPLLFDDAGDPKPAYFAVRDVLKKATGVP